VRFIHIFFRWFYAAKYVNVQFKQDRRFENPAAINKSKKRKELALMAATVDV
jgi:hypothetical protein